MQRRLVIGVPELRLSEVAEQQRRDRKSQAMVLCSSVATIVRAFFRGRAASADSNPERLSHTAVRP
jgi:hypothetical protein